MNVSRRMRGQPLLALFILLGVWVGARAVLWQAAPVSTVEPARIVRAEAIDGTEGVQLADARLGARRHLGPQSVPGKMPEGLAGGVWQHATLTAEPRPVGSFRHGSRVASFGPARAAPVWYDGFLPGHPGPGIAGDEIWQPASVRASPVRLAAAHQTMWMAAIAGAPVSSDTPPSANARPHVQAVSGGRPDRWSADGWLLLRSGGNGSFTGGPAPPSYGASQAGAVLRYRISSQDRRRPTAYLRTTAALNGFQEQEVAVGFGARLFSRLPVVAAAEMRAMSRADGTVIRPALLAWTELRPLTLPLGARSEIYAQAGYVGGRFDTPFADAQLRVDRSLADFGRAELRAGGGAWAGAQKGASRVDVGPAAILGMPIGQSASARVAVDWRFRVTGNAQPASGPALTLSAGF